MTMTNDMDYVVVDINSRVDAMMQENKLLRGLVDRARVYVDMVAEDGDNDASELLADIDFWSSASTKAAKRFEGAGQ